MSFDYSKLKGRIVEKFGSYRSFVDSVKMSSVSLSKKLQNKSNFTQDEIREFATVLDIPQDELHHYFFTPITKKS